MKKRSSTGDMP
jgi:hypothetical protein